MDISKQYGDQPLGPLREKLRVDISAKDYVDRRGFVCQVAEDGDLTYRTFEGKADQTDRGLKAGDTVNVGGLMVALQAVRASSGVNLVIIGLL
ncbi:MAG: hypothetical protein OXI22_00860 [Defluviicoccus sp.]|nr:hypothetical protein [Defluviicoccus sp.]